MPTRAILSGIDSCDRTSGQDYKKPGTLPGFFMLNALPRSESCLRSDSENDLSPFQIFNPVLRIECAG